MSTIETMTEWTILKKEQCCACGVMFAMPEALMENRRKDMQLFYCPNGHSQHYAVSEADKLRKKLAEADVALIRARERAAEECRLRIAEERKASTVRGQLTKVKNRIAAGVCPCCNRTVSQLARHMKTNHPEFPAKPA